MRSLFSAILLSLTLISGACAGNQAQPSEGPSAMRMPKRSAEAPSDPNAQIFMEPAQRWEARYDAVWAYFASHRDRKTDPGHLAELQGFLKDEGLDPRVRAELLLGKAEMQYPLPYVSDEVHLGMLATKDPYLAERVFWDFAQSKEHSPAVQAALKAFLLDSRHPGCLRRWAGQVLEPYKDPEVLAAIDSLRIESQRVSELQWCPHEWHQDHPEE